MCISIKGLMRLDDKAGPTYVIWIAFLYNMNLVEFRTEVDSAAIPFMYVCILQNTDRFA